MKKIFTIILAVLMLFSMSAIAFAGYDSTSTPTKDYVQVDASLKVVTPPGSLEQFNKSTVEPVKGRIFEVNFLIENKTKEVVYADEILAHFGISIVESATKDTVKLWTEAEDYGFNKNPAKIAINPNENTALTYKIYAVTDKAVAIRIIHEEKAYDLEKDVKNDVLAFYFVEKIETTTTVETTTAAPVETTTEAPTETTTVVTTTTATTTIAPTYVEDTEETGGDDHYEAPEVDYEIPNTGSASIIGAVAALGLAAGAIILLKKKKNDE